jgi:predicted TPR repeat methyltransferase
VDPNDVTLATYEETADLYIDKTSRTISPEMAAFLDAIVQRAPGGRILELGSGPGYEADYLDAHGLDVDRTDATSAFVDAQRARGRSARLLNARAADYGGPYDAVLASAVFLHLERSDMERALATARACTREGGVLALTLREGEGERYSDHKLGRDRWFVYWSEDALRDALARAGWRVDSLARVSWGEDRWLHVVCLANS